MFYERLFGLKGRSDSDDIPDKVGAAAIGGGDMPGRIFRLGRQLDGKLATKLHCQGAFRAYLASSQLCVIVRACGNVWISSNYGGRSSAMSCLQ